MGENLKKKAVVIGATGNLGREICKELRKENVTLKFDINHSMSEDNIIAVGEAIQRVDYLEK